MLNFDFLGKSLQGAILKFWKDGVLKELGKT